MGIFDRLKTEDKSLESSFRRLHDLQKEEASLMIEISSFLYEIDNIEESLEYLEKALNIYQDLGIQLEQARLYDRIGDIYLELRDISLSTIFYKEALTIYSKYNAPETEDLLEKIQDLELISSAMEESGEEEDTDQEDLEVPEDFNMDYNEIEEIMDQAIQLLEESRVYQSYHQLDDPMSHIEQAYQMSRDIEDRKGEATLLLIMGDLYIGDGQPDLAIHYFESGQVIFRNQGYEKGEAVAGLIVGCTYLLLDESDKASKSLKKSLDLLNNLNNPAAQKVAMQMMQKLYGTL